MANDSELEDVFRRAVKIIVRDHVFVDGVVTSVDQDKFTADVMIGDTPFYDVILRVLVSSQASVIEIPKVNSPCVIGFRDGNTSRPQMIFVHDVDTLLIKCEQVTFNDGNLGGMVKVEDLVTRLNNVENDVNNLKTVFTSWTPVPNDGGAALKAAVSTWAGEQLEVTVKEDIENPKIKQ